MLERPGEEHAAARSPSPRARPGSRRTRRRRRAHPARERLEQHVDALVAQELPEVDDGRLVAGEERGETLGVSLVRESLVRVARIRRIAACFGDERGERRVTRLRPPLLDVDTRVEPRARGRRVRTPLRRPRGCAPSRRTWRSPRASTSLPHASSAGRPRIEYSSSDPCAFTAYGAPDARPTAPPRSTWLQRRRSAGSWSRTAAAFASTQTSSSSREQSWSSSTR